MLTGGGVVEISRGAWDRDHSHFYSFLVVNPLYALSVSLFSHNFFAFSPFLQIS